MGTIKFSIIFIYVSSIIYYYYNFIKEFRDSGEIILLSEVFKFLIFLLLGLVPVVNTVMSIMIYKHNLSKQ